MRNRGDLELSGVAEPTRVSVLQECVRQLLILSVLHEWFHLYSEIAYREYQDFTIMHQVNHGIIHLHTHNLWGQQPKSYAVDSLKKVTPSTTESIIYFLHLYFSIIQDNITKPIDIMNNVRQNDRRRLRQDAYKRYQALDLVELQELIRERTGNFRRNKNRPTCIKKVCD